MTPKCYRCPKPATFAVVATGSLVCSKHKPAGFVCRRLSREPAPAPGYNAGKPPEPPPG